MSAVRKDNSLFVIDDFYPYPQELRRFALSQPYEDWMGPDGELYKRIWRGKVPALGDILTGLIGPHEMLGMGFRLNYNKEEPNAAIHSDVGWGTHALVHYLSEGPGGTAFWRHKATQTDRIDQGDTYLFEQINKDWNDVTKWEQKRLVEMKFNRALIYESALFHSRWPFEAFGNCAENGRLIAVAFFTPRKGRL